LDPWRDWIPTSLLAFGISANPESGDAFGACERLQYLFNNIIF